MAVQKLDMLYKIISEVLEVPLDQITDDLAYGELENWDSIAHMEMVGRFEEELDVSLDIEEITDMENIGKIKEILRNHGLDL